MAESAEELYRRVCEQARETAILASIDAVLGWDERCLLPPEGGEYRADQLTLLAGLIHDRRTAPAYGEGLEQLADSALAQDETSEAGATIRDLLRDYRRRTKVSKKLVEALARAAVRGQQAWQAARKNNDFPAFRPLLEEMIRLKREEADAIGYADVAYDALLDEFEPGERTKNVAAVLGALRKELTPLVAAIAHSGKSAKTEILHREYPVEIQASFGSAAAEAIGFSFARGRLDVTAHPFCSGMGPRDCRITTRYDSRFFNGGFFGILHEAGHGIYEQGLREDQYGLPLGEACSLGIHESQSRMWENLVGRSHAFWQYFFPRAQQAYPQSLGGVKLDQFFFAINDVRPSLIRVEADEATYNLHILIRFELEQELIGGTLEVQDLPAAWNERYAKALGIAPPDDAQGVLQDIHWSAGLIGYFATYSLGNLYASQFFEQADQDLGGIDALLARGEFTPLREWLRDRIHRHGRRYPAAKLVERVTGRPLDHEPLMRHLRGKLGPLYGLEFAGQSTARTRG